METSTLVVCFKCHCRQQESDQLSVLLVLRTCPRRLLWAFQTLYFYYDMNVDTIESVAQMPCLAGKDQFNFRVSKCTSAMSRRGVPACPLRVLAKQHVMSIFLKKYLFIAYIDPYSHGFQNIETFCLVLFIK